MEYFDIYDENRIKTGRTIPRGTPLSGEDHRLVVHICIFTPDGQMIIQQRQPFKHGWSNMWDLSAGGSVRAGETSREGALREVSEELGLVLPKNALRKTVTIYSDNVFDDHYTAVYGGGLSGLVLQKEEVQAVRTASADEIKRMIKEGIFIPYHENYIDLLFYLKDSIGMRTAADKTVQI